MSRLKVSVGVNAELMRCEATWGLEAELVLSFHIEVLPSVYHLENELGAMLEKSCASVKRIW